MKKIKFLIGDALLALFCCFSLMFPITMCEHSGHRVFAEQEYFTEKSISNVVSDDYVNADQVLHDDCFNECSNEYVSLVSSQYHFERDEIINAVFEANSDSSLMGCDYNLTGCALISMTYTNQTICLELTINPDSSTFRVDLEVHLTSNKTLNASLYAIEAEGIIYISEYSEDDAYEKYLAEAYENGIVDERAYDKMRSEWYSRGVVEGNGETIYDNELIECLTTEQNNEESSLEANGVSLLASKDTYISGTATWKDDNGRVHPLRRIMVKVFDEDNTEATNDLLGTVYTDDTGYYSLTFQNQDGFWDFENGGCDVFVKFYAGDDNVFVLNGSGLPYCFTSSVIDNVKTGSSHTISFEIDMKKDLGKAFQIGQAMLTERDFVWLMTGKCPSSVSVRYPKGSNCNYSRPDRLISITNTAPSTGFPPSYASWDCLMHEYAHHISYEMDIMNSPGGSHSSGTNDADERKDKDVGIRLAWGESWPTVLALVSQQYYSGILTNIDTVGDSTYIAYNGVQYDLETTTVRLGEACERSIMAVLWDIYDSASDTDDKISLGSKGFWTATTSGKCKTFSDFTSSFYAQYPNYYNSFGALLTKYNMASSVPVISNLSSLSSTISPKITWTPQGGSRLFPNDTFALYFYAYESSAEPYYTISNLKVNSYTLSQAQWDSVRYLNGTIYVAVQAESKSSPATGPYISKFTSFKNPAVLYKKISISPDSVNIGRYFESITSLRNGEVVEYSVKFSVTGKRMIQTFGTLDTYMEIFDSSYNRLDYNDDGGYNVNAFINYQFDANEQYYIRIRFYSVYTKGKIKMAITPGDYGTTYNNLEMLECTGSEFIWEDSLAYGRTKVFSLKATSNTYSIYTWYPSNKIDLYLYLIDPRSVEPISTTQTAANVSNDDGGGDAQAKIEKKLESGVPYFLIVSAYNPKSASGQFGFNINRVL